MNDKQLAAIITAVLYSNLRNRPDEIMGSKTDEPVAECACLAWKIIGEAGNRAPDTPKVPNTSR